MAGTVPMDAAGLRAAVADERYWQAGHPEHAAWRAWVNDGFQAVHSGDGQASGGVVHVRAYMREGHMVSAYTRSAPPRRDVNSPIAHAGDGVSKPVPEISGSGPKLQHAFGMRRSLLESHGITTVAARRPDAGGRGVQGEVPTNAGNGLIGGPGGGGGGRGVGGGNSNTPPTGSRPAAGQPTATRTPAEARRELGEILAPGGAPIGSVQDGARATIRTLPGGERAAQTMFQRLVEGRQPTLVDMPNYPGQMYRLNDGSMIGYRAISKSNGGPAVDVNIPGFPMITRLHY